MYNELHTQFQLKLNTILQEKKFLNLLYLSVIFYFCSVSNGTNLLLFIFQLTNKLLQIQFSYNNENN